MAINTRQSRKEAIQRRQNYYDSYDRKFRMFYHNSVVVENRPNELPKRYLLRTLLDKGAIAHDKETDLYLPFVQKGIDVYGLPQGYTLIGFNGLVLDRKPEEVDILRANDLQYPIADYFNIQINKLVDYDLAIEQNLEAVKTMTIAEVSDERALLSLANEMEARRVGATVLYKNSQAAVGNAITVQNTGAQYLIDKLLEARLETLNETLSTIGISTANVDKRERVQGMEVKASQGVALDSINTLIDTFNHDAEVSGLPIRLKGNTSLVIYDITNDTMEGDDTNNE